jgi:hypothetical protein
MGTQKLLNRCNPNKNSLAPYRDHMNIQQCSLLTYRGEIMRKTMFFVVLAAFICMALFSMPALAAPKIAVENPVYDAGDLEKGKPIVYDFIIRNTGDQPLTIKVKPC